MARSILTPGRYYRMPSCNLTTSITAGIGLLRVVPAYIPNKITVAKIGAEITVAGDVGSKLRLGIYADDGTLRPGSLVLDAGQIAGDSATVQEITDGVTVLHGGRWYWFGAVVQSVSVTQPTVRVTNTILERNPIDYRESTPVAGAAATGYAQSAITGALPSTFTVQTTSGSCPSIFIKAA